MNDQVEQLMITETIDTLEKLAFIFAEPEEDPSVFAGAAVITASADFTGPCTGSLVIEFATEGLNELAANMLGLDEDDDISDAEQRDALKEALNIICGNVLPAVAGAEAVFNIAAPSIVEGPFAGDTSAAKAVARLSMDEGFLILYLFCDGDIPGQPA